MFDFLHALSLILPIIASLSVLTIVVTNLYLKIRRKFPVKVNCWFCNEWTKVHYDEQNGFDCPTCLQYNGFDIDGDYNKIIPAQHDELLNHQIPFGQVKENAVASNGLCRICNNNQQLKIYQLANFIPLNEDNFDNEVEHFRNQLEKAYKLCSSCESVVKKTITKQNKWLLGLKLSNLRKQGLSLLDLDNSSNGLTKESKKSYFLYFINLMLIIFGIIIFMDALYKCNFSNDNLNKMFPSYLVPCILELKTFLLFLVEHFNRASSFILRSDSYKNFHYVFSNSYESINNVKTSVLNTVFHDDIVKTKQFETIKSHIHKNLPKSFIPKRPDTTFVCMSGLLLQTVASFLNDKKISVKSAQIFCWILFIIATWASSIEEVTFYVNLLQAIGSILIIYTTVSKKFNQTQELPDKSISKNKIFKKKRSHLNDSSYISENNMSTYDTDTAESDCSINGSIISSSTRRINKSGNNYLSQYNCKTNHIFGQGAIFENTLNKSPTSFEELNATRSVPVNSFVTAKDHISDLSKKTSFSSCQNISFGNFDWDLNKSLDNLHLSALNTNKTFITKKQPVFILNKDVTRPRPILSPPRLKTVNQNSWTAGGFWKVTDGPVLVNTNLSRSSSQSSGFVSQSNEALPVNCNRFSSLPPTRNGSNSDYERSSLLSEPPYHYSLPEQQLNENKSNLFIPTVANLANNSKTNPGTGSIINCSNVFYKHSNPNMFAYNSMNSSVDNVRANCFKSFNTTIVNTVTANLNNPLGDKRVESPFYPIQTNGTINEYKTFCTPSNDTASFLSNSFIKPNTYIAKGNYSDSFCNISQMNSGAYKKGSLFKPLNDNVFNS